MGIDDKQIEDHHEIDTLWRESSVLVNSTYAKACENFNLHCEDLISMFESLGDEKAVHELRAVKSLINMKLTSFKNRADQLRMDE